MNELSEWGETVMLRREELRDAVYDAAMARHRAFKRLNDAWHRGIDTTEIAMEADNARDACYEACEKAEEVERD